MNAKFTSILATMTIATTTLIVSPSYAVSRSQSHPKLSKNHTTQIAQVFRSTLNLPAGQAIATKINRQDTLYINKGETVNASLLVA